MSTRAGWGPFVAIAVALFLPRLVLSILLIPPWQQPDEPQNVALIRLLQHDDGRRAVDDLVLRFRGGIRDDPTTEGLIVSSMAAHGWWRHYGRVTPSPPPTSFTVPADVVKADFGLPGGGMAYFLASAAAFRATGTDDLHLQLYALRVFSAALGFVTILAAAAGARLLFDDRTAVLVTVLLALHPQFLLVSTAANPDAVVVAGGAIAWWCTGRLLTGGGAWAALGMMTAAAAAALAKRVGVPLFVASALILAFWVVRETRRPSSWRVIAAVAASLVLAAAAFYYWLPAEGARILATLSFVDERWQLSAPEAWSRLWTFTGVLFTSSWLNAGWLRYPAPVTALGLWAVVMSVAAFGLVRTWGRASGDQRIGVYVSACYAAIQLVATYAVHFPIGSGPQGRYLFPVIPAFAALVCVGWQSAAPPAWAYRQAVSLVLITFAFDVVAWAAVLLPAYAYG